MLETSNDLDTVTPLTYAEEETAQGIIKVVLNGFRSLIIGYYSRDKMDHLKIKSQVAGQISTQLTLKYPKRDLADIITEMKKDVSTNVDMVIKEYEDFKKRPK